MEEAPQEEVMGVSKGKRTKRVRPQSLITFMAINAHSSSGDANVDGTVHEEVSIIDNNNNNNSSSPLVVTSDENFPDEDVPTEEEEEMAKCLILLSQGGHPPLPHHHHHHPRQTPPNKFFDLFNNDMGFYQTKFNSKRYVETTDLGNGAKAGTYVYECKTCNRTFPSFQALGGHRASHRKPKPLTIEPKKQPFFYFSDHDDPSPPPPSATTTATINYKYNNKLSPMLSPLSAQFNNINMLSPRIHTCSYCGAEFTSGQALGGHMRRHRGGANNNNNNNTILCLSPFTIDQESTNYNNLKKPRNGLSLDLNLPAPTEYHQNQSRNLLQHPPKHPQEQPQKQQQEQQEQDEQQQTALVLSTTPQLIGCHY